MLCGSVYACSALACLVIFLHIQHVQPSQACLVVFKGEEKQQHIFDILTQHICFMYIVCIYTSEYLKRTGLGTTLLFDKENTKILRQAAHECFVHEYLEQLHLVLFFFDLTCALAYLPFCYDEVSTVSLSLDQFYLQIRRQF